MINQLLLLYKEGLITTLEYEFPKFILENFIEQSIIFTKKDEDIIALSTFLILIFKNSGSSYLPLNISYENLIESMPSEIILSDHFSLINNFLINNPLKSWNLSNYKILVNTNPNVNHIYQEPLILIQNRLYLNKYWQNEHKFFLSFIDHFYYKNTINQDELKYIASILFKENKISIDWQKIAFAGSLKNNVNFILGGPGTGKTYTITSILLGFLYLNRKNINNISISLAAPTGKAAMRMLESINTNLDNFSDNIINKLKKFIPSNSSTIHNLLGISPYNLKPKFNKNNPLDYDLIIIDEASMIDLEIMSFLFDALKPASKIIFLGDQDQLPSIEVGSIISEISTLRSKGYSKEYTDYIFNTIGYRLENKKNSLFIGDGVNYLHESKRANTKSGIYNISRSINNLDATLDNIIKNFDTFHDTEFINYPKIIYPSFLSKLFKDISYIYSDYFKKINSCKDFTPENIKEIFNLFLDTRILCVIKYTNFGTKSLNKNLIENFHKNTWIELQENNPWFNGRAILITKNNNQLNLANGDIGIYLEDKNREGFIYFLNTKFEIIKISPNRVMSYEDTFSMTIHKSQGSEFNNVILIFPDKYINLMTKELIYTAITRAKKTFKLYSHKETLLKTINKKLTRYSGLKDLFEEHISFDS
ncbi:MAG: exodeoxyribonuclease V subunit alpha [Psittacicella sp.]